VDEELEDVQAERDQLREELGGMQVERDEFRAELGRLEERVKDAVRTLEHG